MNSPSIQIAFRCDVCHECVIENVFKMNRRERELGAPVCRECAEQAEAAVIGLMVDSVTGCSAAQYRTVLDPYARNVIDFGIVNMYRPPVTRSNNWLGLILGLAAIALAVVAANWVVG